MNTSVQLILELLDSCSEEQRRRVFDYLRSEFQIHPLEAELGISAEMVLESISRAHPLTRRMIRGVFAEAAFEVEVVNHLIGWHGITPPGDLPYDFMLEDNIGPVTIQVKLQRSKKHRPMLGGEAPGRTGFSPHVYVTETQKTRRGEKQGKKTRPYRFGEFDILAAAMQPSTGSWGSFMYTVADWLLPDPQDSSKIMKYQPIPRQPNSDWTDDLETCVRWLRSGLQKRIQR